MPTIQENFQQLDTLRSQLAANLTDKGVETASTEGFATLVPKVANVETGIELPVTTTATEADILSGKTAYNNLGELLTGTRVPKAHSKTGTLMWSGVNWTEAKNVYPSAGKISFITVKGNTEKYTINVGENKSISFDSVQINVTVTDTKATFKPNSSLVLYMDSLSYTLISAS